MTNLNHFSSALRSLLTHHLEIGMRQENLLHHQLHTLGGDVVANVIGVLCEYKDAGVDDFSDGPGEGERQGDDTGPEGLDVFRPVLAKEDGCVRSARAYSLGRGRSN